MLEAGLSDEEGICCPTWRLKNALAARNCFSNPLTLLSPVAAYLCFTFQ